MLRRPLRTASQLPRACWPQAPHLVAATVLVALFALATPPLAAATNVSGTISTNTTWTLANSPYVMTGNVTVNSGVTLTIEPGVTVQGNASTRSLTISGSLSAAGTSVAPITFTSSSNSAPGQWLGITFNSGAGTGTFKYVNARYGGGGAGGDTSAMLKINGGTVTIEDSTFSQSSTSGVSIHGGTNGTAASATIRRTKFESNGFYASSTGDGLHDFNARVVIDDSAFWSNKNDGFEVGLTSAYTPATSAVSGSSFLYNGGYGVYIDQGSGAEALGPDGNIAFFDFGFGGLSGFRGGPPASRFATNGVDDAGAYLAKKAPKQVTPGTRILEGQYVDDLGRVQPWRAHYDDYGRLVGRTDYNAGNRAAGIPDTHHHRYEYSGRFPYGREVERHVPGEYPGGQ